MSLIYPPEYITSLAKEIISRDFLVITGKSLGLDSLIFQLLRIYSQPQFLVFLLNFYPEEIALYNYYLRLLRIPSIALADQAVLSSQRAVLYTAGGVIAISNRVLIADLLNEIVHPSLITCMIVSRAEHCSASCIEEFIVRYYRDHSAHARVLAFTQNPHLIPPHTISPLRALCSVFGLSAIRLLPRFHMSIQREVDEGAKPRLTRLTLDLSEGMREVQGHLTALMKGCLDALNSGGKGVPANLLRGAYTGSVAVTADMVLSGQLSGRRLLGLDEAQREMWDAVLTCGQGLHKLAELDALEFLLWWQHATGSPHAAPQPWTRTAACGKVTSAARARVFVVLREGRPDGYLQVWGNEEEQPSAGQKKEGDKRVVDDRVGMENTAVYRHAYVDTPSSSPTSSSYTSTSSTTAALPTPASLLADTRALRGGPWVDVRLEQAPKVCELERLLRVLHGDGMRNFTRLLNAGLARSPLSTFTSTSTSTCSHSTPTSGAASTLSTSTHIHTHTHASCSPSPSFPSALRADRHTNTHMLMAHGPSGYPRHVPSLLRQELLQGPWSRTVVLLHEHRSAQAVAEVMALMRTECTHVGVGSHMYSEVGSCDEVCVPLLVMPKKNILMANSRHFPPGKWENIQESLEKPGSSLSERSNGSVAHASPHMPVGAALWQRWQRYVFRTVQRQSALDEEAQSLIYAPGKQDGKNLGTPGKSGNSPPSLRELMRQYRAELRSRQQSGGQERKRTGLYARQGLSNTFWFDVERALLRELATVYRVQRAQASAHAHATHTRTPTSDDIADNAGAAKQEHAGGVHTRDDVNKIEAAHEVSGPILDGDALRSDLLSAHTMGDDTLSLDMQGSGAKHLGGGDAVSDSSDLKSEIGDDVHAPRRDGAAVGGAPRPASYAGSDADGGGGGGGTSGVNALKPSDIVPDTVSSEVAKQSKSSTLLVESLKLSTDSPDLSKLPSSSSPLSSCASHVVSEWTFAPYLFTHATITVVGSGAGVLLNAVNAHSNSNNNNSSGSGGVSANGVAVGIGGAVGATPATSADSSALSSPFSTPLPQTTAASAAAAPAPSPPHTPAESLWPPLVMCSADDDADVGVLDIRALVMGKGRGKVARGDGRTKRKEEAENGNVHEGKISGNYPSGGYTAPFFPTQCVLGSVGSGTSLSQSQVVRFAYTEPVRQSLWAAALELGARESLARGIGRNNEKEDTGQRRKVEEGPMAVGSDDGDGDRGVVGKPSGSGGVGEEDVDTSVGDGGDGGDGGGGGGDVDLPPPAPRPRGKRKLALADAPPHVSPSQAPSLSLPLERVNGSTQEGQADDQVGQEQVLMTGDTQEDASTTRNASAVPAAGLGANVLAADIHPSAGAGMLEGARVSVPVDAAGGLKQETGVHDSESDTSSTTRTQAQMMQTSDSLQPSGTLQPTERDIAATVVGDVAVVGKSGTLVVDLIDLASSDDDTPALHGNSPTRTAAAMRKPTGRGSSSSSSSNKGSGSGGAADVRPRKRAKLADGGDGSEGSGVDALFSGYATTTTMSIEPSSSSSSSSSAVHLPPLAALPAPPLGLFPAPTASKRFVPVQAHAFSASLSCSSPCAPVSSCCQSLLTLRTLTPSPRPPTSSILLVVHPQLDPLPLLLPLQPRALTLFSSSLAALRALELVHLCRGERWGTARDLMRVGGCATVAAGRSAGNTEGVAVSVHNNMTGGSLGSAGARIGGAPDTRPQPNTEAHKDMSSRVHARRGARVCGDCGCSYVTPLTDTLSASTSSSSSLSSSSSSTSSAGLLPSTTTSTSCSSPTSPVAQATCACMILSRASALRAVTTQVKDSADEQALATTRERETAVFDKLISDRGDLVMTRQVGMDVIERETDLRKVVDGSRINYSELASEEGVGGARSFVSMLGNLEGPTSLRQVRRRSAEEEEEVVIVDSRELRSALCYMMYREKIRPRLFTLPVADYILTPTHAVERKAIPDLIQSLQSGRLATQLAEMIKAFPKPMLLLEWAGGEPMGFDDFRDAKGVGGRGGERAGVRTKLIMTLLSFPAIQLLWSFSPEYTTHLFRAIKRGHPQPQPPSNEAPIVADNEDETPTTPTPTTTTSSTTQSSISQRSQLDSPLAILSRMPGVSDKNISQLTAKFPTLAALCVATEAQLSVEIGAMNAGLLYRFLHKDTTKL